MFGILGIASGFINWGLLILVGIVVVGIKLNNRFDFSGFNPFQSDEEDDDDEPAELSSNSGWSQLLDWVATLSGEKAAALAEFTDTGTTTDLQPVADQIKAALGDVPPIDDVKDIANTLIQYLDGEAGIASVV